MNARWLRFALALSVLGLASCICQSVWLTVTRRASAPPPPVSLPTIAPGLIPIPVNLPNRFLPSLPAISSSVRAYADQLDPRKPPIEELSRAIGALEQLWADAAGAAEPPLDVLLGTVVTHAAKASCDDGLPCRDLVIPGVSLRDRPSVVRVIAGGVTYWRAVLTCEALRSEADPDVTPSAAAPDKCADWNPRGTMLTVAQELPVADGAAVTVAYGDGVALARTFLTFVHLSDAQLRDADVKLGDPELSARLDHLIESFEHDEDQELYGDHLLAAMVATINREVEEQRAGGRPHEVPSLVMHTGDSIDAGTVRELERFHAIMDQLKVPWFNVLGNHDVLVFGNLLPAAEADRDDTCVDQASIVAPYSKQLGQRWFLPARLCVAPTIAGATDPSDRFVAGLSHAESRRRFIAGHRHESFEAYREVPRGSRESCSDVLRPGPNDAAHGFDLQPRDGGAVGDAGHYAFAVDLELGKEDRGRARRALFIALNSEDLRPHEGGNTGRLGEEQYAWLQRALGCARPHDLVLLFAHHPPGEIAVPGGGTLRTSALLRSSRNIVGYFYGHSHVHGLCRAPGACQQFWEVEAGSLIEHPQEGRLVRLKYVGGGLAFIETATFTERLADRGDPFGRLVTLARQGADRDHCLQPGARCSADQRVRRKDGDQTGARLFFRLP